MNFTIFISTLIFSMPFGALAFEPTAFLATPVSIATAAPTGIYITIPAASATAFVDTRLALEKEVPQNTKTPEPVPAPKLTILERLLFPFLYFTSTHIEPEVREEASDIETIPALVAPTPAIIASFTPATPCASSTSGSSATAAVFIHQAAETHSGDTLQADAQVASSPSCARKCAKLGADTKPQASTNDQINWSLLASVALITVAAAIPWLVIRRNRPTVSQEVKVIPSVQVPPAPIPREPGFIEDTQSIKSVRLSVSTEEDIVELAQPVEDVAFFSAAEELVEPESIKPIEVEEDVQVELAQSDNEEDDTAFFSAAEELTAPEEEVFQLIVPECNDTYTDCDLTELDDYIGDERPQEKEDTLEIFSIENLEYFIVEMKRKALDSDLNVEFLSDAHFVTMYMMTKLEVNMAPTEELQENYDELRGVIKLFTDRQIYPMEVAFETHRSISSALRDETLSWWEQRRKNHEYRRNMRDIKRKCTLENKTKLLRRLAALMLKYYRLARFSDGNSVDKSRCEKLKRTI